MTNDPQKQFMLTTLRTSLDGLPECSERFAVLLYGLGVASVTGLLAGRHLTEDEASYLFAELRRVLDAAHPNGFALFEAKVREVEAAALAYIEPEAE